VAVNLALPFWKMLAFGPPSNLREFSLFMIVPKDMCGNLDMTLNITKYFINFILDVIRASFMTTDVYIALNGFICRMAAVFRSLMKARLANHSVSMKTVMAVFIGF
jgi:hypothetical protein